MKPLCLLCPAQGPSLRGPPQSFSVGLLIRPSALPSRAEMHASKEHSVCTCTGVLVCMCAQVRVCIHMCTCMSVCTYMYYAGTCDMGTYRAHSVAAVSTCPEGATPGRHPRPTSGRCGSCGRRALGQGDRARDPVLGPPVEGCPSPAHFTSYPDATPGPLQLCELSLRAVLRWKSHEIRRQQCRKKIKYFFVFLIYEVRMCNQNIPFG